MKRRITRSIALVLLLVLLFSTSTYAAVTSSLYIAATNAYVTRSGDNVNVYFYIVGRSASMDKIGATKIYVYEQNGTHWPLVKTFDSDDSQYTADMIATNTGIKSGHVTYTEGDATKNYYAIVKFYAEKDGGHDSFNQDTPVSYGTTS